MDKLKNKQVELAENELNEVAGGIEGVYWWIDENGVKHWGRRPSSSGGGGQGGR